MLSRWSDALVLADALVSASFGDGGAGIPLSRFVPEPSDWGTGAGAFLLWFAPEALDDIASTALLNWPESAQSEFTQKKTPRINNGIGEKCVFIRGRNS